MGLKRYPILQSVSKLAGASILAQIVSLMALPFISRLFEKEMIGLAGIVMTISTLLSFLASGNYGQAIVIAKQNSSKVLLRGGMLYAFFFSLLLFFLFYLFGRSSIFSNILWQGDSLSRVKEYWGVIPWVVFVLSIYMLLAGYANQKRAYSRLAFAQFIQSAVGNGFKVGLGFMGFISASSLIFSSALGVFVASLALLPFFLFFEKRITLPRIKKTLLYYRNFPLYSSPMMLVNSLVASLTIILLPRWYGLAEIGLIAMAAQVSSRPLSMVTEAFSRVYCKDFAERVSHRKLLFPLFKRFMILFVGIVLPMAILLYLVMPYLVSFLLGNKWQEVTPIIRAMIPYLSLGSLVSIFNFLPEIFNQQRRLLFAYLLILVYESLLLYFLASRLEFQQFYSLFYLLMLLAPLLFMGWLYTFIARYDKSLKK